MEDSYVLQLLKPKFKDFYLCFCGFAECEPLHSYGPAARPNYILHYVVFQFGTFYRLKSPFEGNETVWMVTNEDRTLAIVCYYRFLNGVNQPYSRFRLQ